MSQDGIIIFEESGLYGAKTIDGDVLILPQYKEMSPFSFGLSLVRDSKYRYAYIDKENRQVIPFGVYHWCDPFFVGGFARVAKYNPLIGKTEWGIIDSQGILVIPLCYDQIWSIKESYFGSVKAYKNGQKELINLFEFSNRWPSLNGLKYIITYTIDDFKSTFHCSRIYVRINPTIHRLFFTYGSNIGYVGRFNCEQIPLEEEIVVSIVVNSLGQIFPLLHYKLDIGKTSFEEIIEKPNFPKKIGYQQMPFKNYDNEIIKDSVFYNEGWYQEDLDINLKDVFKEDIPVYMSNTTFFFEGWSQDEFEELYEDAFEGDPSAYWNID